MGNSDGHAGPGPKRPSPQASVLVLGLEPDVSGREPRKREKQAFPGTRKPTVLPNKASESLGAKQERLG